MNYSDHKNIQLAYQAVYDQDLCESISEGSISWDTGRNARGQSPRNTAALRQQQFQNSSNQSNQLRGAQISKVRTNMRTAIQNTKPSQLSSAGPIASTRFRNAAIRQRGGTPNTTQIPTVPGLRQANQSAQDRVRLPRTTWARYGSSGIGLADDYEYELYDIILEYLIQEGYADCLGSAEVILENMSEDWMESIMEGKKPLPISKMKKKESQLSNFMLHDKPGRTKYEKANRRFNIIAGVRKTISSRGGKGHMEESYDFYNALLEYLLDEGYVNTIESAEVILENMSEDWMEEILSEGRTSDLKYKYTTRYGKPEGSDTLRLHSLRKKYDKAAAKYHLSPGYNPHPIEGKAGKQSLGGAMYKAGRSKNEMRGKTMREYNPNRGR